MFNKTALKESVIDRLYQKATDAIVEGYSDNPFNKPRFDLAKQFLNQKFMTTWRVDKGPNWDFNMQRPDLPRGVEDGDNFYEESYSQLANQFSPSYLKLAKAAYFLDSTISEGEISQLVLEAYDESTPTVVIDTEDDDETDTEAFIASLHHADENDSSIELLLGDGSDFTLDSETIKKLLDDNELILKLLKNLDSVFSVATVLGLDVDETDTDEDESEEDLDESESIRSQIKSLLESKAENYFDSLFEAEDITKVALAQMAAQNAAKEARNTKVFGKLKVIKKAIRNGKVVNNIERSNKKGWKVLHGKVVKMSFAEKKKRKLSARFAVRKRAAKMATIVRKMARSMMKHNRALGLH